MASMNGSSNSNSANSPDIKASTPPTELNLLKPPDKLCLRKARTFSDVVTPAENTFNY